MFTSSFLRNLPAKAGTEGKRRQGRDTAKEKAREYLRAGKTEEAKKEFTKAVDITHDHAVELMRECRKLGVDCITAMYEADSQLAYLNKIGSAEFIISEDSDLILFGCRKIIFKLQLDGRCLLFESEKLYMTVSASEEKFSFEKFRQICILSGCDYLDNLPGIGLSKAKKFITMTEETDMKKALLKIPSYLNMKKLEVPEEYIEEFLKAEATFKHMFVYNPLKREMLRLNPIDDNDPMIEYCSNAGKLLQPSVAYQLALGNINPRTFVRMDNFDPDTITPTNKYSKYPSIWKNLSNLSKGNNFKHQSNISKFFNSSTQRHKQLVEVQNIIEQENNVTSEVEIDDLVSSYCVTEMTTSKRRNSELENEAENRSEEVRVGTPNRNPFAKRHQLEPKKSAEKPSLLESLSSKECRNAFEQIAESHLSHRVVSRFFVRKKSVDEPSPATEEAVEQTSDESDQEISKIKLLHQERQLKHDKFYDSINSQKRDGENSDSNISQNIVSQLTRQDLNASYETSIETQETQDESDVVDLEKYQFKANTQKQSFINNIKPKLMLKPTKSKFRGPGLSKAKAPSNQKSDDSSIQTKLSKFGFQKKSALT